MRCLAVLLASLLLVVGSVAQAHDDELQAELLDEVLRLTQARVGDDIILEQIAAWDFAFELSADDIVELRSLGVSDPVLEALIGTGVPQDDAELARTRLYFGAGYYSPWYAYPYAWGAYCDPFPRLYSVYYYPFYYGAHFGYYGWYGGTYYAHYHPKHWRSGLRYGGRHPNGPAPYTVTAGRGARPVTTVTVPRTRAPSTHPATPRVLRSGAAERTAAAVRRGPALRGPQRSRAAHSVGPAATAYRRGTTPLPAARGRASRELRRGAGSNLRQPAVRSSRPALRSRAPSNWSSRRGAAGSRTFTPAPRTSFSRPAMSRAAPAARPAAPPPSLSGRLRAARPR